MIIALLTDFVLVAPFGLLLVGAPAGLNQSRGEMRRRMG